MTACGRPGHLGPLSNQYIVVAIQDCPPHSSAETRLVGSLLVGTLNAHSVQLDSVDGGKILPLDQAAGIQIDIGERPKGRAPGRDIRRSSSAFGRVNITEYAEFHAGSEYSL